MSELIPRFSIEALVASRDAVVAAFKESARIVHEATNACDPEWNIYLPRLTMGNHTAYDGKFHDDHLRDIDRAFWNTLMEKSGIRDTMSASAMRDMSSTIDSKDCPEFTIENIKATFAGLFQNREKMFGDFVMSIYRHISWDHKTNAPAQFGKKMILHGATEWYFETRPSLGIDSVICELERALCILTENPVPTWETSIRSKIESANWGEWIDSHTGTFSVKLFKNRNAHIKVRPDLIRELNQIVASAYPNALPWKAKAANR